MRTKGYKSVSVRIALVFVLIVSALLTCLTRPILAAPSIDFVRAKSIGGHWVGDILLDKSGNIYMNGHFSGTTDFDPGAGTYNLTSAGFGDIFVSKLDNQGNFVWAKSMGGSNLDFSLSIAIDLDENIYTTGHFRGTADFDPGPETYNLTSLGENDIFVSKLDMEGNFVWAKSMGGSFADLGTVVLLDVNKNVYVTGFFSGLVDFDPGAGTYNLTSQGSNDIFISKLDANGNFIWAKRIGGSSDDRGRAMVLDNDGNIYAAGVFSGTVDFDPGPGIYNLTGAVTYEHFITKLDRNGNFLWAKNISAGYDHVSINVDRKGNVFTTGEFSNIVDFDPGDGVYNLTSTGPNDIFIMKLDTNGNFVWARNFVENFHFEYSEDIVLDASENLYTTGQFSGTTDFDPGSGTYNLTAQGSSPGGDIFINKLNSHGNFVWAKSMGGTNNDSGVAMALYGGNVYTVGNFEGTADFDPGPGVSSLSSTGGVNTFISILYETVIRYVKWDASGANNGSSWEDAYTDLQSALAAASSGDEIWVAAGTYKPTTSTDRAISFALKNGVATYGGFAGTETLLAQRNPTTSITVLSGDIGAIGVKSDNSYHVVVGSGANNSAILDGFTITAGNASGGSGNPYSGGGIYNNNGSPSLKNMTFSGNMAVWGGGIANENHSDPSLTNVVFSGNSAAYGGGMSNDDELHSTDGSDPILTNVIFDNNSAQEGGGIMNFESCSPVLTNVTFHDNKAVLSGGGMVNHEQSNPILINVTFDNNSAGYGGGMVNQINSSPTLTNVTFSNNSALHDGGGMLNRDENSSPILTNVTLSNNSASGGGGAIANAGHPTVINSIIWGNTGGEIFDVNTGAAIVSNSIVQGGYSGTGNIDADALVGLLQDNGGFTQTMALLPGSPAIDAGDDANCPATDQRGVTRP